jgi:hypothetical protein
VIRGVPTLGIYTDISHTASTMHEITLPKLCRLEINTDGSKQVFFGRLPSLTELTIGLLKVGRLLESRLSLLSILSSTHKLFKDVHSIASNLTDIKISVKANWLHNLAEIWFPVVRKLIFHATDHYHAVLPEVRIDAPCLETGRFFLFDSCCSTLHKVVSLCLSDTLQS